MKRSVPALVLALALLFSLGAAGFAAEESPAQRFSDVSPNHWAYDYIEELSSRGAIDGYPDGKFYPEKTVTREEFAKIMVMAAGLVPQPAAESTYADVSLKHWSSPYIETARPYMTAYQSMGQLYFYPFSGALREDMAVAVVKLRGFDPTKADLSLLPAMFNDLSSISEVARPYVALAVEQGIINGYNDGTFRGQGTITRAEAAAILYRAFQQPAGDKVIPDDLLPTPSPEPSPTVTPEPSPEPSQAPEPSTPPEPTQTPEEPDPVTRYGYILSTPYSVSVDGNIYSAFEVWNGTETVSVLDRSAASCAAGTAISYLEDGTGKIEVTGSVTEVGAVVGYNMADYIIAIADTNGTSRQFTLDGETVIIYFDSSRHQGVAAGNLMLASQNDDSAYIPNVFYQFSEDGKNLAALFVEVNNQIDGASVIPAG